MYISIIVMIIQFIPELLKHSLCIRHCLRYCENISKKKQEKKLYLHKLYFTEKTTNGVGVRSEISQSYQGNPL